jgi:eukaryotic-like serine/threonine-protein kinase
VPPDKVLKIMLSSGHAPVPVPGVSGVPFKDAAAILVAKHFKVQRAPQDQFSAKVKKGDVISTDPPIDSVQPYGTVLVVHVSKGPDLVVVPDVTIETVEQASIDLEAAGLQVGDVANYRKNGVVVSQSPSPDGGKVPRGTKVNLVLKKGHGNG